ncbi:Encode snake venom C-type Lectin protein [Bothrops jararaca]|uniref:Encode snake venom C-type Lectin protein n=1 Tax=Bothrops jararaca TaxID=8724 RepID=A0A8T1N5V4_BOTJA|nr:Encode snake venom C-type Lectin protein [Bothrops jararaca]
MGRFIFVSFGLLVVAVSLSGTGADFDCPSGWSAYDQYCYKPINEPQNWDDAERFCSEEVNGGHLVSIESAGEADFVAKLVAENKHSRELNVWIGMRVQGKEKQCSSNWSDGSCVCYENLVERRTKKCFVLEGREGFRKWSNLNCEQRIPFVCEV